MIRLGVWLLILGVGGIVLPLMGFQFRIMSLFGENQTLVGGVMALAGVLLIVLGRRQASPE